MGIKILHALVWMGLVFLCIIVVPLFSGSDRYWNAVEREYVSAAEWFGEDQADRLFTEAAGKYNKVIRTIPLREVAAKAKALAAKLPKGLATRVTDWFELRSDDGLRKHSGVAVTWLFLFCWRLQNLAVWVGYLLPILMALAWDGWMERSAKAASTISRASPTRLAALWHATIAAAGLTLLLPFMTLPPFIGYLTPWAYPVSLLLWGYCVRQLSGCLQASA